MWTYRQTDELYHYGIPGMKWGHRKARPTTSLGRSKAAYKTAKRWGNAYDKAATMNTAKKNYKEEKKAYKQTKEYKARRKKVIKAGAAVAGTALAAYGAKKVYDLQKDKKTRAGREAARQAMLRATESYANRPLLPGQLSRKVTTYYD